MKPKTDMLTGLVVLVGIGVLYVTGLPQGNGMMMSIAMDPAWYPGLLLVLASLCAGGLIVTALVRRHAVAGAPDVILLGRMVSGLVAIALYITAFWYLGYWAATLLFIPIFSVQLGYRRPVAVAGVTLLLSLVVWLVFTQALQILLRAWPW